MTINWRNFFIGLVIINVLIVGLFLIFLFSPGEAINLPSVNEENEGKDGINLTVTTNKHDLTQLINHYLEEEFQDQILNYKVLLSEKVMLIGSIPAFGKEIDLVMTFEPIPQANGDLMLQQESISLGNVQLPVSLVLRSISDNYALPDWITIDPSKHTVYAAITDLELKSDVNVRVNTFDLEKDDLSFSLIVPNE
ncbi:YpmS family protein [Bacillus sp. PS06]|uniref:YpmS family protein n=1 Tax=Bacillus sp. PS06 TaxID=2764176 RepID=UPI00177DBF93|nr:YpmS family protein [Bacillus sp. PS06]MBD8068059.1 YpmS family protein [Bacillus sp. PS06]